MKEFITLGIVVVLAVFTLNAGGIIRIGIQGGYNFPILSATVDRYPTGIFIEPLIEFALKENLKLEISGGTTTLDDEDNWWAESYYYYHSLYDNITFNANENSITLSLKAVLANTYFSVGISNVWRHYAAITSILSGSGTLITLYDNYKISDFGYILGTGLRVSSFAEMIFQARIYSSNDMKILFGLSLSIPSGI